VKRWILAAAIGALACTAVADEELDRRFGKDVLIIEASAHGCHRFDIYVAADNTQKSRGLMFVRDLPVTTGMLFIYDNEPASMWMKNTFIPLDILFIRRDGTVSSIDHDTEPQSLRSIHSIEPISFVLELNAGTAERLVIDENSRIYWEPAHGDVE
jgi:uncharacterized membrane protein (UPF0127 family)